MLDFLTLAYEPAVTTAATAATAAAGGPWWESLLTVSSLMALLTLTTLEIVLGIDNIVFIAIVTQKLPEAQRAKARQLGLLLAMGMRIILLLGIVWVLQLDKHVLFTIPWLTDPHTAEAAAHAAHAVTTAAPADAATLAAPAPARGVGITGKDLVLLLGGLFLIAKSTWEIRHQVHHPAAGGDGHAAVKAAAANFSAVIAQILMLDLVFSLDSVITAAGMTNQLPVMIAAVVIAVGVMLMFAGPVSRFVEKHPEVKILALAFLILIGVLLVAEGMHQHFERGYVYFAMAFALVVDLLQMRAGKKAAAKA